MSNNNKSEYGNGRSAIGLRDGLLFFGVGAGIGAALALLFAPKSGVELRGDIVDVSKKGYDATRQKALDLKEQSADAIKTVKDKAVTVYDFAVEKLSTGSDAVNEAVSAAKGALKDGVENIQNEADAFSTAHKPAQKSSAIM